MKKNPRTSATSAVKKQVNLRAAVLAAMADKGWTAYRLGKASGVPPSHVARWLDPTRADHQRHITTKLLEPMLTALGMTLTIDD